MIITVDPIAELLAGGALAWIWFRTPKNIIKTPIEPQVQVPQPISAPTPSESPAVVIVLHRQPDGSWSEVGHAVGTPEEPGERILRELATPGRAVRWPDGTVQEN